MTSYKNYIQNAVLSKITPQEKADISDCKINQGLIDKLVSLAKNEWLQSEDACDLYCAAMAVATIIKEYDWGIQYLLGDGLWEIANRIQKSKSGLAKDFERQFEDLPFEPNQFWVDSFQGELRNNIDRFMENGQVAFSDLVKQCIMYSCDMGIHFYKSGCFPSLPKGILRTIVKSVCVAMQKNFPAFNDSYHYEVLEQVEQKLSDPSLYNQVQKEVDAYYNRI